MPLTADDVKIKRTYWGTGIADDIEQGAQNLMIGAATKVQEMAQDQEGVVDDALRLVGGGIRNVQAAAADQEGITDDALRLVGGGISNTLKVLGIAGEVGGWAGGKIAGAVGVDPRIGGAAGNIIGDVIGGGIAAKGLKIARYTKALRALDPIERGAYATTAYGGGHVGAARLAKKGESLKIAATQVGKETLQEVKDLPQNLVKKLKIRTNNRKPIEQMLDDIYTEGMDEVQKEGWKAASTFGGKGSITGTHRDILQQSPHHFGMDLELTGKVIKPGDAQVVRELNKLDVFPGNHPNNFIGSYHDMTKRITDSHKRQIIKMTGKSRDEVNAFLKNPKEGGLLGRKELQGKSDWKVMDMIESLTESKTRNWNKFLEGKGTIKDFDLPKALVGADHQDLIHGAINSLTSRKRLENFVKSSKWKTYTPRQKAAAIAVVAKDQQNIALNVNKWRLDKIKKAMKFDPAKQDWTDIQAWMIKNPHKAASLDWHKTAQIGTGMTIKELTADLPASTAREVAQTFNLELVPKTSQYLKQMKSAKRSELKAILRDLKYDL